MKIFTFGSCRTKLDKLHNPDYIIYNNYDFIHTTKEVITHLDLLYGVKKIDNIDHPECLVIEPEKYDSDKYRVKLEDADLVLIEISSFKQLELNGTFYQLNRATTNKCTHLFNITMQTENEFCTDIQEIYERIKKPIVFVSHLNLNFNGCDNAFGYIESRAKLDTYVQKYCKAYVLPKEVFQEYDCKDIVTDSYHLTVKGYDILNEGLVAKFKELQSNK
jgi:hypothetical protein